MNNIEKHKWIYSSPDERKCSECLIQEFLIEMMGWLWMPTDEFMDSDKICEEG